MFERAVDGCGGDGGWGFVYNGVLVARPEILIYISTLGNYSILEKIAGD